MTSDLSVFSSKSSVSALPPIYTADGSLMSINHVGHVSTPTLALPHTFYIPKLTLNLISVG